MRHRNVYASYKLYLTILLAALSVALSDTNLELASMKAKHGSFSLINKVCW